MPTPVHHPSVTAQRAKPGQKVDFKVLANDLLFGGKFNVASALLEYRKGKTVADVHKAREKALKNGHAKTEFELSMLELYLKDVFKANHAMPADTRAAEPASCAA